MRTGELPLHAGDKLNDKGGAGVWSWGSCESVPTGKQEEKYELPLC